MTDKDCSGELLALLETYGGYHVVNTLRNLIAVQRPDRKDANTRTLNWNITKELLKETKPMQLSAQQALQQAHREFAIHWPAKQAVLDKGDNVGDMTQQDLTGEPSPYEAVKAERDTWVDARVKFLLWTDMQPLGIVNGAKPLEFVQLGVQKA